MPVGKQRQVAPCECPTLFMSSSSDGVDALEPIGLCVEHLGHVVGGVVRRPRSRARAASDAAGMCTSWTVASSTIDAGALGADERARDVEAVLGQQLVEVVAGDAPRDVREALADQVGVAVAQVAQPRVDLAPAPALADDLLQLSVAGRADGAAACRRRAGRRARRRCRPCAGPARRTAPSSSGRRTSCCRSCRRACSGRASRDRARRSAGARPRPACAGGRGSGPAARGRARAPGRSRRARFRYLEKSMTTATLQPGRPGWCRRRARAPARRSRGRRAPSRSRRRSCAG